MPNFCYILYNDKNKKTYNGYTNNLERRIRQHNCEIKGGARYTTNAIGRDNISWKYLAVVECPEDMSKSDVLALEWMVKYPTRKRPRPKEFNGPQGRLAGLNLALIYERWAGKDFKVVTYI